MLIINKALYGLKSSWAAFRSFLAERLDEMNFKPSMAEPDVLMRAAVKSDGEEYYEYILVYVDDITVIGEDTTIPLSEVAEVHHIFAFLRKTYKLTLYFDSSLPDIDETCFKGDSAEVFREQYRDAAEELPPRMPKPRYRQVYTPAFVDASHVANKVSRNPHTGFLILINRASIICYCKRQNAVESKHSQVNS